MLAHALVALLVAAVTQAEVNAARERLFPEPQRPPHLAAYQVAARGGGWTLQLGKRFVGSVRPSKAGWTVHDAQGALVGKLVEDGPAWHLRTPKGYRLGRLEADGRITDIDGRKLYGPVRVARPAWAALAVYFGALDVSGHLPVGGPPVP